MKAGTAETSTDVRHSSRPVERSKKSYSVYEQKRGGLCRCTQSQRPGKPRGGRNLFDSRQVVFDRLVRHKDEPGMGVDAPDAGICLEKHGFVLGPRRACYQRRGPLTEAEQWVLSTGCSNLLQDAVEAGVAENSDTVRYYAEPGQAIPIIGGHRRGCRHNSIPWLEEGAGGPPKARALWADSACNYGDMCAPAEGSGGKLRPQVQLGEHQEIGFECREQPVHVLGDVVGQVIGCVGVDPGGEPCGRRAEVSVNNLALGAASTKLSQHCFGLETFAE